MERLETVSKAMDRYAQEPAIVDFAATLSLKSVVMRDSYGACRAKVQYSYIAYSALCSQLQHESMQLKELVEAAKNINSNPDIIYDPTTSLRMVEDFDRTKEVVMDIEDKLYSVCEDLTSRVNYYDIGCNFGPTYGSNDCRVQ